MATKKEISKPSYRSIVIDVATEEEIKQVQERFHRTAFSDAARDLIEIGLETLRLFDKGADDTFETYAKAAQKRGKYSVSKKGKYSKSKDV